MEQPRTHLADHVGVRVGDEFIYPPRKGPLAEAIQEVGDKMDRENNIIQTDFRSNPNKQKTPVQEFTDRLRKFGILPLL